MTRTKKEKRKYSLILIAAVAAIVVLGVLFYIQKKNVEKKGSGIPPYQFVPTPTPTPIPSETVMMVLHGFVPETLTIKKGTYVNFANFIDTAIDIEADPKSQNSSMLNIGIIKVNDTSKPFFFKDPGTYQYYDKSNPSKKGKIVVE